ncbi:MAG: S8 family serine peptidase [Anaerolinea sp.]|nr:S8 family serine peptidase [Anaerolinea sp.]
MKVQQTTQQFGIRFWSLLIVLLFITGMGARPIRADMSPVNYESDQIVVKIMPTAVIDEINSRYSTSTVRRLLNNADIYLLQAASAANVAETVDAMSNDPDVQYAELNLIASAPEASGRDIYGWPEGSAGANPQQTDVNPRLHFKWEISGSDSTYYYEQPAVHQIKSNQSFSQGSGIVVAILDTGIDLDHPILINNIIDNGYDFIDNDAVPEDEFNNLDDDGDGFIDEAAGHGTHVAGIVHLVAPSAQIMPLRVLDSDGQGNSFVIAEAMLYALENGADVINLSSGTTRQSQFLLDVVEQVTAGGIVVVAAAGNLNEDTPQYPAAAACALAVTAVGPGRVKADYANYGAWVDLVAPGERIYSTYPDGVFAWWNGSSMATPFVAGQVALIHSHSPSLTLEEVGQLIAGTAESLDNANHNYNGLLGAGLIDIQDSLEHLVNGTWPDTSLNPLEGCNQGS